MSGEEAAEEVTPANGRSLGRRLARAFVALALLLVLGGLGYAVFLRLSWDRQLALSVERFEQRVGSLDPASYAPAPVPAEENFALVARDVAARLDTDSVRPVLDALGGRSPGEWSAVELARLEELLAAHQDSLAALDAAVDLERSNLGLRYAADFQDQELDLLLWIRLARLQRLRAGVARRAGDCGGELLALRVAGRIASVPAREPTVVHGMLAEAAARLFLEGARDLVGEATCFDESGQRTLLEVTEHLARAQVAHRWRMGFEAALLVASTRDVERSWKESWAGPNGWGMVSQAIDVFAQLAQAASGPRPAGGHARAIFEGRELAPRETLAWIVGPNFAHGIDRWRRLEAQLALARVALDSPTIPPPGETVELPVRSAYAGDPATVERAGSDLLRVTFDGSLEQWRQEQEEACPGCERPEPVLEWWVPFAEK